MLNRPEESFGCHARGELFIISRRVRRLLGFIWIGLGEGFFVSVICWIFSGGLLPKILTLVFAACYVVSVPLGFALMRVEAVRHFPVLPVNKDPT